MLASLCVVMVVLLLAPGEAWAWGPITHLTHGAGALASLTTASVALQRLLGRNRLEYLYGCVGADITQAKKYTRAQQAHCHSWEVGWEILNRAESDKERAFAWGYLTHLAGDVYSHNHFVPTQMIVSFRARALRHVYWEACFDTLQPTPPRDVVRELRTHDFPECDRLVERVVSRTLFSFRMDKRIFNSFIAVHDFDQWQRILRRLAERSRYPLPATVVTQYNTACQTSILDLFVRGTAAASQSADPTGFYALEQAKRVRATLRALARTGRVPEDLEERIRTLDTERELGLVCCSPSLAP